MSRRGGPAREQRSTGAVELAAARLMGPVRTCVGCRGRAAKSALLRVVMVDGVLTVDQTGRLPGRGASVHPDQVCVDLAERRRAFPRALRVPGPLDVAPVKVNITQFHPPIREQVEKP